GLRSAPNEGVVSASQFAARRQRLGNLVQRRLDPLQFQLGILVPFHPPLWSFVKLCSPASQGLSPVVCEEIGADSTDAKDSEWNKPFAHWPLLEHPPRFTNLPVPT